MLNLEKINKMKAQLAAGVQVITAPQLFPTPRELAQHMADIILEPNNYSEGVRSWNPNDCHILEPSAGTGVLLGALGCSWHPAGKLVAVELNASLCQQLEHDFPLTEVYQGDFMEFESVPFDRIIMNPPFINGADILHIKHAVSMLKEGGRLVAICAGGPRQKKELEPLVMDSGGIWEPLPAGTFKSQATNVNSVLLTIEG